MSWSHGKQAGGPGGNGRNHGWGRGYPRPAGSQPSQQGAQVSFPRAGAGASTSQYQGPGSSGGFQREAQRLRGPWQGTKRRQCHVSEEGRRTECVALSAKPGGPGPGRGAAGRVGTPGWRAPAVGVALGPAVCVAARSSGRAGGRGSAYGASRVVGGVSCTAGIRKLPPGAAQVPVSLFDLRQLLV